MLSFRFPRLSACLLVSAAAMPAADSPDPSHFAAIPGQMQAFVDRGEISGAVMLVATRDQILHLSAVGRADLASKRPMKTEDVFWIASMSKPITATAIALLVEEGKLQWDDPVEKYLPEFRRPWMITEQSADRRVLGRPARPITVRDLLTHTSGMGEYAVTDPHWTLNEMTKVVAREPLRFEPGSRWGYSTAGIDVLGRIVEVVSGQPFADFMRKRLFEPLGMRDTTFWLSPSQEKRFATNYRLNLKTGKLEPTEIFYMYGGAVTDHARPPLGGAGLFSTAEDVARFYQMILSGGELFGRRILKAETIATMTSNQTGELTARPGMSWGYGFCVVMDPKAMGANTMLSPGSYGHGGAHGTSSWVDPKRGAIYIIMLQRGGMQNPDNSDMHRVFQETAAAAFGP